VWHVTLKNLQNYYSNILLVQVTIATVIHHFCPICKKKQVPNVTSLIFICRIWNYRIQLLAVVNNFQCTIHCTYPSYFTPLSWWDQNVKVIQIKSIKFICDKNKHNVIKEFGCDLWILVRKRSGIQIVQNSISPWTLLRQLTMIPRQPSRLGRGGYHSSRSPQL